MWKCVMHYLLLADLGFLFSFVSSHARNVPVDTNEETLQAHVNSNSQIRAPALVREMGETLGKKKYYEESDDRSSCETATPLAVSVVCIMANNCSRSCRSGQRDERPAVSDNNWGGRGAKEGGRGATGAGTSSFPLHSMSATAGTVAVATDAEPASRLLGGW